MEGDFLSEFQQIGSPFSLHYFLRSHSQELSMYIPICLIVSDP